MIENEILLVCASVSGWGMWLHMVNAPMYSDRCPGTDNDIISLSSINIPTLILLSSEVDNVSTHITHYTKKRKVQ